MKRFAKATLAGLAICSVAGTCAPLKAIAQGMPTGFASAVPPKLRLLVVRDEAAWVFLYRWHLNGLTEGLVNHSDQQPPVITNVDAVLTEDDDPPGTPANKNLLFLPEHKDSIIDVPPADFAESVVLAAFGAEILDVIPDLKNSTVMHVALNISQPRTYHFAEISALKSGVCLQVQNQSVCGEWVTMASLLREDMALRKKFGTMTQAAADDVAWLEKKHCPEDDLPLLGVQFGQHLTSRYCVREDLYWIKDTQLHKWFGPFRSGIYTPNVVTQSMPKRQLGHAAHSQHFLEAGVSPDFEAPRQRALVGQLVQPPNLKQRRKLQSLNHDQRARLMGLIQEYVTEPVLTEHVQWHLTHGAGGTQGPGSGVVFLEFHRNFVKEFETWLSLNGGIEFVPIPMWDPSTPLPAEFPDPDPVGNPRRTTTPRIKTPTWCTVNGGTTPDPLFGYKHLADFKSADELGRAFGTQAQFGTPSFHASAHVGIGGTMSTYRSPLDPMFWFWHSYLDNIYSIWEQTHT